MASEKVAYVLLKGFTKSNYETIQPYIEIAHEYIMIDD